VKVEPEQASQHGGTVVDVGRAGALLGYLVAHIG
jgi:hypothetical protein